MKQLKSLKRFCREFLHSKSFRVSVMCCLVMCMMVSTAFAAEEAGGTPTASIDTAAIQSAFVTGINDVVVSSLSMISAVVPFAITLAGTIFLARKAMGWWKSMAK